MKSAPTNTDTAYINPLTVYLLIVWSSIFLLLVWNSPPELIAKVLFAPFLLDISKGVGDLAALFFRGASLLTLLIMILFIMFRIRPGKKSKQALLSFFGMIWITIHYGLIALGYLTTGLH